jgi:hypothetical protein
VIASRIAPAIVLAHGWQRAAIAFAAGVVSALAMAPFNAWPVLFVTFPVLFGLIVGAAGRFRGAGAAAIAAAGTPLNRPAPAPSISHTITGKVTNSTGQALNGAIASDDSAPATSAMAARFQPHARMIASATARSLRLSIMRRKVRRSAMAARWMYRDSPPPHRGAELRANAAQAVPCARRCAAA